MNKIFENIIIVQLCFLLIGCKDVYNIDMVYISGGSFLMGSEAAEADLDERPIHSVNVKDFYLSKYEVTQELWMTVMGRNPSHHRGPDFPVENVSWDDCLLFIDKLNHITGLSYRLPTEEEWEYVATLNYKDLEHKDITSYAWCLASFGNQVRNITTQKVGKLKSGSLGIYDIIGNVNEWCSNSYDSLSYHNGFARESDEKVFRGGCFANEEMKYLSHTNRNHINRYTKHFTLGLRLAMDAN